MSMAWLFVSFIGAVSARLGPALVAAMPAAAAPRNVRLSRSVMVLSLFRFPLETVLSWGNMAERRRSRKVVFRRFTVNAVLTVPVRELDSDQCRFSGAMPFSVHDRR
jgi:hypothetical protein